MPLRVYCPECNTPRTAPAVGARVRCRVCDRVFRAGTRAGRRDRDDDPTRQAEADHGSRTFVFALGAVGLVLLGLVLGCGLAGWFFLTREAACPDPPDEEMIEVEEDDGPPPVFHPGPVNPPPLDDP